MKKKLLTIFNYNIHKGFNVQNNACVIEKVKQQLDKLSPDMVLLQEVQGEGCRVRKNIPKRVAAPHHTFLAQEGWEHLIYGKNAVYKRGNHGNAILSKYPILESENFNITTNLFEKRGILYANLELPNLHRKVHLYCTHFNLKKSGRKIQLARFTDIIESHTKPHDIVIVGGDFNDFREDVSAHLGALGLKDSHRELKGQPGFTFPSVFPILPLDRIYYKGITPKHTEVLSGPIWKKLSDHLPIMSTFELTEEKNET